MHSDCTTELLRIIKTLHIMAQMKTRPEIKFLGEVKSRETEVLASGPQILSSGSVVIHGVVPGGSGFLYEQSLVCFTVPFAAFS